MNPEKPKEIFNDGENGFILGESDTRGGTSDVQLEFRHGENNETAKARKEEESRMGNEFAIQLNFDQMIESNGQYDETLAIQPDGNFKRDDNEKFSILGCGVRNKEDLFRTMKRLGEKNPQYKFSFETDPNGQWLKFTVKK